MENLNPKTLEFLKKVEIFKIQMMASNFHMNIPPELLASEKIDYSFEHRCNNAVFPADENNEIFCFVETIVKSNVEINTDLKDETKKDSAFQGKCRFVVRYLVKKDEAIDDAVIHEFCKNFSVAHAYPYIRSHIESQFNQMGLQGFTLPLYKADRIEPSHQEIR